ncbi:MAG: winged helix-turn-helix transcriptional regulator [Actinobacteria bacterium]|nr:winged helix-turn-helix transcriptional regulator [Actinomycetota bacterium]
MGADTLSRTFAALADPTRRAILERLVDGDATVNEIAEPFEITLQAVSKHLKVLEAAGLVSKGRDGQHRRCHAEGTSLDPAICWLDENRQQWEDRLDRLGDHLRQIQRSTTHPTRKKDQ